MNDATLAEHIAESVADLAHVVGVLAGATWYEKTRDEAFEIEATMRADLARFRLQVEVGEDPFPT